MTTYFPGILANGSLAPGLAAATVRTAIGLGTAAVANTGTAAGNVVVLDGSAFLPAVDGSQLTNLPTPSLLPLVLGTNLVSQRNSTNAQAFEVYKTYTSATSNERWYVDTSTASFLDIIAGRGSAGGAENGIRIGGKLDGGSFVPWLSFESNGGASFRSSLAVANPGGTPGFYVDANGSIAHRHPTQTSRSTIINAVLSIEEYVNATSIGWYNHIAATIPLSINFATSAVILGGTLTPRTGTATAGTSPIKLTTGVLHTTPEAGAIEYDGTNVYFTDSGGTRRQIAVV